MPVNKPTPTPAASASVAELAREAARLAVGLTSLAVGVAVDTVTGTRQGGTAERSIPEPLDALIGLGLVATRRLTRTATGLGHAVGPIADPVWRHLPSGPTRWVTTKLREAADLGRVERQVAERDVSVLSRSLAKRLAPLVLDQLDLTAEVLERVDVDAIVKSVDLDAIVGRLDLVAVVDRLPIDRVVDRVDIDGVVARVNVDGVVEKVDLKAVVDRVDVDAVVDRVDVDAVIDRVDVEAVINRLDLVGIAQNLIAELNMTELIRESTGSVASDLVRDARVQSMSADETVNRLVDRLFRRRRPAPSDTPALDAQPDGDH